MSERLYSRERNVSSSALDSGKGSERTWKKTAWKLAGYGALAIAGLAIIAGL